MKFDEYITEVSKSALRDYGVIKVISANCQPFIKEFKNIGLKQLLYRGSDKTIGRKSMVEVVPRDDRLPKDMPQELHELLDDEFKRNFGWYARSEGVFVTSKLSTAESYGNGYIFMPVGEYQYLFNPKIDDLYSEFEGEIDNYISWENLDIGEFEYEWDSEFGKGGRGTWYYDGIDTEEYDIGNAIDVAAEAEGIDPDEISESDMEWVPDVSWEDWIVEKQIEHENRREEDISRTINGYKNKNLKQAVTTRVEIMFKCKKYYLIDKIHEKPILDFLIKGKVEFDPAQMEFEFEKNPQIRKQYFGITPIPHKYNTQWHFQKQITGHPKHYEMMKKPGVSGKYQKPVY